MRILEEPVNFRRYFHIAIIIAALLICSFICLLGAILIMGGYVDANTIEEYINGQGSMDHASYSKSASDRAMAEGATVSLQMKRDWRGSDQKFSSQFLVSGAKGGYKNQYVVKASGAGYKHTYQATKITGDFSGSGESSVIVLETGTDSIDSLILMDGNATFRGRVINGQTGEPVNEAEMEAVGEFVIRSYLNITEEIETPDDWLGFCGPVDKDLILSGDANDGIYIIPLNDSKYNYVLQDGEIVRLLNVTGGEQ